MRTVCDQYATSMRRLENQSSDSLAENPSFWSDNYKIEGMNYNMRILECNKQLFNLLQVMILYK